MRGETAVKLIIYKALLIISVVAAVIDRFVSRFPDSIYLPFMLGCVLVGAMGLITERKKRR
jgi:hypothetical protein